MFLIPKLVPLVRARIVPRKAESFFRKTFTHVIEERKKTGGFRNDLIDIFVALQKSSEKEDSDSKFTDDMLLAQATVFFLAGFETSSSAMAFALYELARKTRSPRKTSQGDK